MKRKMSLTKWHTVEVSLDREDYNFLYGSLNNTLHLKYNGADVVATCLIQ